MSAFADYPTAREADAVKPLLAFKDAADVHPGGRRFRLASITSGAHLSSDCSSAHRRRAYPADIYALDVRGFNAYRSPETEDVAQFKRWIVDGHYTNGTEKGTELPIPRTKPMILTEWGAPASIRTREGQPPPPPNPQWVSASPLSPSEFHGAPGYRAARLIEEIASDIYGPHSTLSTAGGGILSGGYVFEFQDEWWKEASACLIPGRCTTLLYSRARFRSASLGAGFASYWDEEWFGPMSVATGAGRCPDSPVLLIAEHGERSLNGGADVLTPRAGYYALQGALKGATFAPKPIVNPVVSPTHLIPISFPLRQ